MNGGGHTPGEALARRFHETYERLAPSFGYETRPDTKAFDPTSANGQLMIAVCDEVLLSTIEREQILTDALERLQRNFGLLLDGKPVRDIAETKAEVALALARPLVPVEDRQA